MKNQFNWKVGGQQGEGVDSTGELMARALFRFGYHITTYKQFMSRIKGGHTNYKIRATEEPCYYAGEKTDLLLCMDKDTYPIAKNELHSGSIVVQTGEESIEKKDGIIFISFPFQKIAKEIGNTLAKNMIMVGVSGALMKIPHVLFDEIIEEIFSKKSEKIIKSNQNAIAKGYQLIQGRYDEYIQPLPPLKPLDKLFMSGNQATAFGSYMAGCRFLSAYPITPASEIMEWLASHLPEVGGTIMQVEDEIAGITTAIGASFAGARAMTSTSGPGLSLKTEAVGMAGISEIPIVIVDSQRAGPSTGLPTKHEQSDLYHLLFGGHGEIPRIVLYPATIQDAFYIAMEAFNLAEQYQCPVFIALDLAQSMNKMTVSRFDAKKIPIQRGKIVESPSENYQRYAITEDGISPRAIPGTKNGAHTTSSNEHGESGYADEDPKMRVRMMNKRMEKIQTANIYKPYYVENIDSEIVIVGMGSTYGIIQEAIENLKQEKISVGHVHVQQIHPLPIEKMNAILKNKKVITVENNYTGQLLNWLKINLDIQPQSAKINQYDGNPFTVARVCQAIKELI